MSLVLWRISYEKYDKTTDSYASPIIINDYNSLKMNVNIGSGKDSFDFKLTNANGDYNDYFNVSDRFVISRKINDFSSSPVWSDSDILMTGATRDVPLTHAYNRKEVSIKGYNYSETLMNAVTFVDATNMTVAQAIKDSIEKVGLYNTNFQVTWHPDNPMTKEDGSSFPVCNERFFNKNLNYILEKYSATVKTEDGNYYYYVDSSNRLVWRKMKDSSSDTFSSVTNDYHEMVIKKDTKDVKNFVIIKGGLDAKGRIIQDKAADYPSIASHGFRYYVLIDEKKTASSYLEQDMQKAGVDDMADATYPFTPTWTTTSYSSFKDYNDDFRLYIRAKLRDIGESFIAERRFGRLMITIKKSPDDIKWALGSVIDCDIPQLRSTTKLMRVTGIDYGTFSDQYTLKEDEATL